jgi:hypothetical protein
MITTADDLFQVLVTMLQTAGDKPAGLTVAAFPVLDMESTDLPYLGLTLAEGDQPAGDGDASDNSSIRKCTIQAEIWAKGDSPQVVARPYREWLLKTIFMDETLSGRALRAVFDGYQFAPAYLNGWLGCTVLHISFEYNWHPC